MIALAHGRAISRRSRIQGRTIPPGIRSRRCARSVRGSLVVGATRPRWKWHPTLQHRREAAPGSRCAPIRPTWRCWRASGPHTPHRSSSRSSPTGPTPTRRRQRRLGATAVRGHDHLEHRQDQLQLPRTRRRPQLRPLCARRQLGPPRRRETGMRPDQPLPTQPEHRSQHGHLDPSDSATSDSNSTAHRAEPRPVTCNFNFRQSPALTWPVSSRSASPRRPPHQAARTIDNVEQAAPRGVGEVISGSRILNIDDDECADAPAPFPRRRL